MSVLLPTFAIHSQVQSKITYDVDYEVQQKSSMVWFEADPQTDPNWTVNVINSNSPNRINLTSQQTRSKH